MRFRSLLQYACWFFISQATQAQKSKPIGLALADDTLSDTWANAVIGIRCFPKSYILKLDSPKTAPWQGTGILMMHRGHYFVVTAKHVLANRQSLDPMAFRINFINDYIRSALKPGDTTLPVPQLGKIKAGYPGAIALMKTSSDIGVYVLELDSNGSKFVQALIGRRYRFIDDTSIDTCLDFRPGDPVSGVGIPEYSGIINVDSIGRPIGDSGNSIMLSTGRIEQSFEYLPWAILPYFYTSDMFGHGFSGGPVLFKNKMIGLVSRGDRKFPNDGSKSYWIAVTAIERSKFVMDFLNMLCDIFEHEPVR